MKKEIEPYAFLQYPRYIHHRNGDHVYVTDAYQVAELVAQGDHKVLPWSEADKAEPVEPAKPEKADKKADKKSA